MTTWELRSIQIFKPKPPLASGVYLWDIPTVLLYLYLAISDHVAATAVLSLTL